jgi:hypothetical protein
MTAMAYRKLDANHDYVFGNGKQSYLTGIEAVAQAILTRLKLFTGEWWEDKTDGLPVWTSILGTRSSKETVDRFIQSRILETPNVVNLTNLVSDINRSTRQYVFSCAVNTVFGALYVSNQEAT